jgi:NTE family protein
MTKPRIGVAISGGGFRATAFGLGCLRALHDTGVLPGVSVISGISGGSLLAALYAYGSDDFADFDHTTTGLLRSGLQGALIRRALTPPAAARNLLAAGRVILPRWPGGQARLRTANRTDALRDEVTHRDLVTVITATDLRTGNAVRFGSRNSSCSAYGIITEPVIVAEAVAASAAFPLLLPAMERTYTFTRPGAAAPSQHVLLLTDGGIYDNLGLSVLEPGRSADYTAHVYDVDYIIACDAGRGRLLPVAGHFAGTRLRRSFDIVHRRAQDAARAGLHAATATGQLQGVVHAYLGMSDQRVPIPIADLVPVAAVRHYPTDFKAVTAADMQLITTRGEQLTRVLLAHYCPDLSLNP